MQRGGTARGNKLRHHTWGLGCPCGLGGLLGAAQNSLSRDPPAPRPAPGFRKAFFKGQPEAPHLLPRTHQDQDWEHGCDRRRARELGSGRC